MDSSVSSLKFAKPETREVVSKILKFAKDKEPLLERRTHSPLLERRTSLLLPWETPHRTHQGAREEDVLEAQIHRGQAHVQETWQRPRV
jgi:hypothetical protein